MTCVIYTAPKRRLSAKLAAAFALSAILALGPLVVAASAQDRRDDRRGEEHRGDRGEGNRGHVYYPAPPVVYGSPYAYPPPAVVYGPAIGIEMPGIDINTR